MNTLLKTKGKRPRTGGIVICSNCKKEIYKRPCHLKWKTSFCSRNCYLSFVKENAFSLECIICKKRFNCQPCQVKYRNRKTCSVKCRIKLARLNAIKRRKEKGYTKHQLDRLARYCIEAKEWRKQVFERDNYTCQKCGLRSGNGKKVVLNADHIKPFAYFPELRYELSNGRTLCVECHNKTKISAKEMKKLYKDK